MKQYFEVVPGGIREVSEGFTATEKASEWYDWQECMEELKSRFTISRIESPNPHK